MNTKPLVSIIIVNYNGRNLLENCFKSLEKVIYSNFEIILVDNNSDDDSIQYIKENYPETMVIKLDENYGFAKPNNIGSEKAKGQYLLFLNNDTIVTPNFIDELVNAIEDDPQIGICQSLLLKSNDEVDSSGDFVDDIGIAFSSHEKSSKIREILSAKGASMIMRKSLFVKLGGFDEKFFVSFEDVDLGWRSWIIGCKVVLIPRSVVYHLGGQTAKEMKKEIAFHGFKNQLAMKFTNFESSMAVRTILLFYIIYGTQTLRVFFDYLFKGKTKIQATKYENTIAAKPNFSAIVKGMLWNWANLKYLIEKHRFLEKNRKYSTKDLMDKNIIIKQK
jgi:GT2 family glycosyltransferase